MKFPTPVLAALATLVGLAGTASAKPNVVLVVADDLGWSDLGCYGGEIPTPNLDALAAGGLRFRQFYNNAVCGPTRASILTGLHCQRVGHGGRHWNQPTDFSTCVTLGEVLQPAGYRTLMVGKWQERVLPARRGFDRFFGPMCQGKISYFNEVRLNPFYLDERRWPVPPAGFSMTDALTDHAVRFVEEATRGGTEQPFFLYLAYVAPHWPLHATEAEVAPHRDRYRTRGWDEVREARLTRQKGTGLIPNDLVPAPRPAGVHA
jgi:arylsulfatase A-like enzyme